MHFHEAHGHRDEHASAGPRWSAVLDVGGDVGALILYTREELLGAEIEVSPVDEPNQRTHTQVLRRSTATSSVCAGLYMALQAGTYRIWGGEASQPDEITIEGGRVAEVDWR